MSTIAVTGASARRAPSRGAAGVPQYSAPVPQPRWLDDVEDRAWRGYRRMRGLLDLQLSRDLADESGFSDADYDVLSTVSESDDHRIRFTDLARRMLWSKSRLSHQITRMQQRGLVDREEHPADGRGTVVVLTDHGWDAIRAAAPAHVASVRRHLIDQLSRQEIEALGDIAEAVVRHLSAECDTERR
jgi:DNA-binding MarR family transcriptional regulator